MFIYFHFFSNIIHFSHCFWELFFAVSHDMFNTTCAFLFKSIVLTFLTKISTANSIWGFRNVDKVLFFYYFSPLFSIRTVFCISPLTLNWRTRSRCVHFISFAYRAFVAFYPNSDSKMWMEWNTWEFCFKKLATFRNSKPCQIYIPEIETHFKICFIIMVTIVYKTLKIRIWIHYIIFVFSEHDVKMHIIS